MAVQRIALDKKLGQHATVRMIPQVLPARYTLAAVTLRCLLLIVVEGAGRVAAGRCLFVKEESPPAAVLKLLSDLGEPRESLDEVSVDKQLGVAAARGTWLGQRSANERRLAG